METATPVLGKSPHPMNPIKSFLKSQVFHRLQSMFKGQELLKWVMYALFGLGLSLAAAFVINELIAS